MSDADKYNKAISELIKTKNMDTIYGGLTTSPEMLASLTGPKKNQLTRLMTAALGEIQDENLRSAPLNEAECKACTDLLSILEAINQANKGGGSQDQVAAQLNNLARQMGELVGANERTFNKVSISGTPLPAYIADTKDVCNNQFYSTVKAPIEEAKANRATVILLNEFLKKNGIQLFTNY